MTERGRAGGVGVRTGNPPHLQDLLTDVNIPYAGAVVYLPDVAAGRLWNVNYTDFLLGVNSSPRPVLLPPSTFSSSSGRPQDQDTNTSWQPAGRAGVMETRGSAAGRRNSGPVQFYCYLPKRANYIWSLMWNLFCRLSVNKLCGSSQAAYLTFSEPFPHTSSSTFTRAGSCGAFTANGTSESLQQAHQTPRSALASFSGPAPPQEAPPLHMRPLPFQQSPSL